MSSSLTCDLYGQDMFTAGTDTSSSTLEWAMAELLRNPKTMVKAQAEIDRVMGQKGIVEESDILECRIYKQL